MKIFGDELAFIDCLEIETTGFPSIKFPGRTWHVALLVGFQHGSKTVPSAKREWRGNIPVS
jgi:hypothetical protein